MALTRGKIIKANNEEPDEVEKAISQVIKLLCHKLFIYSISLKGPVGP